MSLQIEKQREDVELHAADITTPALCWSLPGHNVRIGSYYDHLAVKVGDLKLVHEAP